MPKSELEIIIAHKKVIEIMTGKKCSINLSMKEEDILKNLSLNEIQKGVEKYNYYSFPINSKNSCAELVRLRKIFSLLAMKAGFSAKKISGFLNFSHHSSALYNLREAKYLFENDSDFKKIYHQIQNDLFNAHNEKLI